MTTIEYKTSAFWLESYRDGFIEFTRNDDDPECFEIQGIFTPLEAIEVHTFISPDYTYLNHHAQSLFDWLVNSPQQRVTHPQQGMGGANRFYLDSNLLTSFTAIRPECSVPWYPYVDDFPEPILLVFAPTAEAKSVGWIESELLPEFRDFDLVISALEDYFEI
ncbi:hypothetical protein [Chlorogloea sp. CCALA 695]|uniref:hypothetical protein n=1 Tax=Chlorogloea sp. CCALA 695 TaxID=2107693 RepID=UPI000D0660DF|nr:hypothetical protein [Chlorogloea sp. CCALA 695]PSB26095.1 hypothetical protein C7B70_24270 [Chlorogloea sp. CCALA 695]